MYQETDEFMSFKLSNALFMEGVENGGRWQFREEEEREQRPADTAKSNCMKQAT